MNNQGEPMSILPITVYGDKILRRKAVPVEGVDIKVIELIKNMFDTMHNASGIGLAANQVGSELSIFVVDVSEVEGYENIKPFALINPLIIEASDETCVMEEGCLSLPDIRSDVSRPKIVKVKYFDLDMKEHIISADELLARVIQHEYDHLQGILFTDKLSEPVQKKFKKNLQKIRAREVETDYPLTEKMDYVLR